MRLLASIVNFFQTPYCLPAFEASRRLIFSNEMPLHQWIALAEKWMVYRSALCNL